MARGISGGPSAADAAPATETRATTTHAINRLKRLPMLPSRRRVRSPSRRKLGSLNLDILSTLLPEIGRRRLARALLAWPTTLHCDHGGATDGTHRPAGGAGVP